MSSERIKEKMKVYRDFGEDFLYDYQKDAIIELEEHGNSGLILQGPVGCGKSRTGLYWYFKDCGGCISGEKYIKMWKPKDLYIITTAHKRDTLDWEFEMIPFLITVNRKRKRGEPEPKTFYPNLKVVVDSWQNISKYENVTDSYFIFDEDHVVSFGAWTDSFIKITKAGNKWIVMTATPADKWAEYAPIFVACGFYRNKSDFERQHVVWDPWVRNFPKIKGYMNTGRLIRLRNNITVQINYEHDIDIYDHPILCDYDISKYNYLMRERFDLWKNEPIQNAGGLCYCLRRVCNESVDRLKKLVDILDQHKRVIVFYNYDYELYALKEWDWCDDVKVAELNGHAHDELPTGEKWLYLCQYSSGAEAWNCISTNVMVFFSQTYSYKMLIQAKGRINRQNTPYNKLHYYHFISRSPIDISIKKALSRKKKFNESSYMRELGIELES